MGLTSTAIYAVQCAEVADVHRTLASWLTSMWTELEHPEPIEVATFGNVVVVPNNSDVRIQPDLLSSVVGDAATVLSIMVFESDVAEVHAYETGEWVASARFGLPALAAMAEEMNEMIEMSPELATVHGWTRQTVPTDALSGEAWWMSRLPHASAASLLEIVNGRTVYVEERVVELLEPFGISDELLGLARGGFGPRPATPQALSFLGAGNATEPPPDELTEIGDVAAARAAMMQRMVGRLDTPGDHSDVDETFD